VEVKQEGSGQRWRKRSWARRTELGNEPETAGWIQHRRLSARVATTIGEGLAQQGHGKPDLIG